MAAGTASFHSIHVPSAFAIDYFIYVQNNLGTAVVPLFLTKDHVNHADSKRISIRTAASDPDLSAPGTNPRYSGERRRGSASGPGW